jgi:predicted phosphodiesterase
MKIVLISDTHEQHEKVDLPDGDVLIHAGDSTYNGSIDAFVSFTEWMKKQPFTHKILIAGNHERSLDLQKGFGKPSEDQVSRREFILNLFKNAGITYLEDSEVEIDGIKFYGSAWTPRFGNWSFMLPRGNQMAEKWVQIPNDVNVLITHGPPKYILDIAPSEPNAGCGDLAERIKELTDLKLSVFGHLHDRGGKSVKIGNTTFVNAAICTERYDPTNLPQIFEI